MISTMMSDFAVIVFIQAVLLWCVAYRRGMMHELNVAFFKRAAICGVCFGVPFDIIIGAYAGVYDYALGFNPVFLVINGVLSWGLWAATIMLLRDVSLLSFWKWTAALGVAYEVANHFFPVWHWTFGSAFFTEMVVIAAGYTGLALLTVVALTLTTRLRFNILA